MLAKRIPTILQPMSLEEAIETTRILFRKPHHTISDAGLIGGGAVPRLSEVSLEHNGVLFLDELPEFQRNVLEVMRQPLEDGSVTIARTAVSVTFGPSPSVEQLYGEVEALSPLTRCCAVCYPYIASKLGSLRVGRPTHGGRQQASGSGS